MANEFFQQGALYEDIGALKAKAEASANQIRTLFEESREQTKSLSRIESAIAELAKGQGDAIKQNDKRHATMQTELESVQKDVGNLKSFNTKVVGFAGGVSLVFTALWAIIKEMFR
jgi:uncharacterized protein YjcR